MTFLLKLTYFNKFLSCITVHNLPTIIQEHTFRTRTTRVITEKNLTLIWRFNIIEVLHIDDTAYFTQPREKRTTETTMARHGRRRRQISLSQGSFIIYTFIISLSLVNDAVKETLLTSQAYRMGQCQSCWIKKRWQTGRMNPGSLRFIRSAGFNLGDTM